MVGAGPGGLQMGYFLDRAGRDYVILEKSDAPGTLTTFPQLTSCGLSMLSLPKSVEPD